MKEHIGKQIRKQIRKKKHLLAILLIAVLTAASYCYQISKAATAKTGTVNTSSGSLTVRSGPGAAHGKIGSLAKGTIVSILEEEDGWYKIVYGSGEGYVSKDYIGNVKTQETDDKYNKELITAGFPESYAQLLGQLHTQYPKWQFEPVATGLDWAEVIKEESKLGKNLVQKSGDDAQKSTAAGAYNWSKNSWYGFDGASWVCASEDMISYAMDPRNFLNAEQIFQFEALSYQNYQTSEGTAQLLKGSFMSGKYKDTDGKTKSYANTFTETGKSLGVSPYHLAARCKQEQGDGKSGSISGTYGGYKNYFNYFNVGAYAASGRTAVENGLIYAKKEGWNSRTKSIQGGSKVVASNYVLKGQDTIYFEKFNVVNHFNLYGHQYMTNVQAAISEGKISKKAYSDLNQAFVFRIPVYRNMPKTCPMPSGGNPNNWLSSLKVSGYDLTPSFQGAVTDYSFIVKEKVDHINISASPVAKTATISGIGEVKLNYGKNKISIVCKAQNGQKRTYTLNAVRNRPAQDNTGDLGNQNRKNPGDINRDGKISNADLVLMKKQILRIEDLDKEQSAAADINGDRKVSNADLVLLKKHILGIEKIKQ